MFTFLLISFCQFHIFTPWPRHRSLNYLEELENSSKLSSTFDKSTPVGTRGLSRECVLRIPMRAVKGD